MNAVIGMTSYCVILKMKILHDARTTIQNGVFVFFLKREQKSVCFKKGKKNLHGHIWFSVLKD